MSTIAHAHPNIALIKYWGKESIERNIPSSPSISLTINQLTTRTSVRPVNDGDRFLFGNEQVKDEKITRFLEFLRHTYAIPPIEILTENNFPTGAGLASSASGFAALVTALNEEFKLGLAQSEQSVLARMGSGSAARSIFGGIVSLEGPTWAAQVLLKQNDWPLDIVVAITDDNIKDVSSSVGMTMSKESSPYYDDWVKSSETDFKNARKYILQRNFDRLIEVAESNCLKMHAVMLSTLPSLFYWNPATVACIKQIRDLREQGIPVFFTIDAGAQVKAICLPGTGENVAHILSQVPGVLRTISATVGEDAWIET